MIIPHAYGTQALASQFLQPKGHGGAVLSGHLSADGTGSIASSLERNLRVRDDPPSKLLQLNGHRIDVYSVAISPDGTLLLSRPATIQHAYGMPKLVQS